MVAPWKVIQLHGRNDKEPLQRNFDQPEARHLEAATSASGRF
jgi:hypothetical protein